MDIHTRILERLPAPVCTDPSVTSIANFLCTECMTVPQTARRELLYQVLDLVRNFTQQFATNTNQSVPSLTRTNQQFAAPSQSLPAFTGNVPGGSHSGGYAPPPPHGGNMPPPPSPGASFLGSYMPASPTPSLLAHLGINSPAPPSSQFMPPPPHPQRFPVCSKPLDCWGQSSSSGGCSTQNPDCRVYTPLMPPSGKVIPTTATITSITCTREDTHSTLSTPEPFPNNAPKYDDISPSQSVEEVQTIVDNVKDCSVDDKQNNSVIDVVATGMNIAQITPSPKLDA